MTKTLLVLGGLAAVFLLAKSNTPVIQDVPNYTPPSTDPMDAEHSPPIILQDPMMQAEGVGRPRTVGGL